MRVKIATMLVVVAVLTAGAGIASSQSVWEALDVLDRRVAGMLRVGMVHGVDHDGQRLQVNLGKGTAAACS